MAQRDGKLIKVQYKHSDFVPKLRKNRKIELRWGNEYYEAVKTAVFGTQRTPFMPEEPPHAIKEGLDKTGYVCKQCRDCFRFLSSVEEHTSRRSWVLGYWCQQCSPTACTHKSKGKSNCSSCADRETSKQNCSLGKGAKKNMKKGATKIFYNQCQFFAHVKSHGTTIVDLSELMLMPLPCGIEPENFEKFDKICKALMEIMFVRRVHIMDWVREKKIVWKAILNSEETDVDSVADIVDRYREDCVDDQFESSQRQDNPIQFQDIRRSSKIVDARATSGSPRIVGGNTRRKTGSAIRSRFRKIQKTIVPKDIAFVDCGSVPNNCIPETTNATAADSIAETFANEKNTDDDNSPVELSSKKTSARGTTLWRSFCEQYALLKNESRDVDEKSSIDANELSELSSVRRTIPRVLTIRNPTNLNLRTVIDDLPKDSTIRKNIAVNAVNSKITNGISASSESLANDKKRSTSLVRSSSNGEMSIVPFVPNNVESIKFSTKHNISLPTNSSTNDRKDKSGAAAYPVSRSFSEQLAVHGKIVFQNGRKYVIKLPKLPNHRSNNVSVSTSVATPKRLLLPKPMPPATISSPAGKPVVIKRPSLPKMSPKIIGQTRPSLVPLDRRLLSENNKSETPTWHKSFVVKVREAMEAEFSTMDRNKLDSYVKNLKEINEAYMNAVGLDDDSVVTGNSMAIERFEKLIGSLSSAGPTKNNPNPELASDFEIKAKNWEFNILDSRKRNCGICRKRSKMTSYIVGLSPPATDENIYCRCYNNICHLCDVNQGSLIQLKFHIKWHKREKPFVCPDCARVFKSANDLEVHVWTTCFHPLARHIYGCAVCEIDGILDMEAVTKHFMLMHTRRKFVCSECKLEYANQPPTDDDLAEHAAERHSNATNVVQPKQLFSCNLKQCVVPPELFRAHLANHVGVLKSVYYKCPFCPVVSKAPGRNKTAMLQHITEHHLDRLHEIVSTDSLQFVVKRLRLLYESTSKISQVRNASTSGPMIINARTITPQSFERGSEDSPETFESSNIPQILEVRSESDDFSNSRDFGKINRNAKITGMESMTDNPSESSSSKSEESDAVSRESVRNDYATIALEKLSSPLRASIVGDDGSNSNDDEIVVFERPDCEDHKTDGRFATELPRLERKPSPRSDDNDGIRDFDATDDRDAKFVGTCDSDESSRRPGRIALNNPSSLETTPVSYNCHLCGESINTSWSVVKNHFASHHSTDYELSVVSPQIPQISPDYIDGGYKDGCDARKRKNDGHVTPGNKRRRRWGPKKYCERPGSPSFGLCVQPEPVREIEGSFRCKKCGEQFGDISMMREHIAVKHRIKSQYLICLECGENFVVVPSLQMHLKALHGIQDPINYLSQHTSYAPDIPEDTDEEEITAESNQCYVCMAVFADKAAVDKHLRVHGMAFLRRKRFEARKAQKFSEKTIDSSNGSSAATSPDDKSLRKDDVEVSNTSASSVETPIVDRDAGNSDDRTENPRTASSFPVKNLECPAGVDNGTNLDDVSEKNRESTPKSENNAACSLETTESS